MAGYHRLYYLDRVEKIQEVAKHYQALGVPNTVIFKEHIAQQFNISKSTFDKYLGVSVNVERQKERIKAITRQHLNEGLSLDAIYHQFINSEFSLPIHLFYKYIGRKQEQQTLFD